VFAHPLRFACDGAHLMRNAGTGTLRDRNRSQQCIIIVPVRNQKKGWGMPLQDFW
jgi:hypothetical protein